MSPINPMDPSNDVELSETERRALADMSAPVTPPPAIEQRTLAELRARGLVRNTITTPARTVLVVAAAIAAIASAIVVQRTVSRAGAPQPRFILLLYGGDTDRTTSRRGEYEQWARSIARAGTPISGEELADAATIVPASSGELAAAPLPRGYFIVSVATIDDARRVASSCPHLQHGGNVVIRGIVEAP